VASVGSATVSRVAAIASLLALAAVGWALTGQRMDGMDNGPGTALGGLGWFMVSWLVMMAAMMLPSLAPAALSHTLAQLRAMPGFVAGYLGGWAAAGLAGYAIVEGVRSLQLGFLAWDQAGRYAAAGAILAAAGYQLTPVKDRCLRRCRRPLPRDRSLRAGIEHAGFCVGCCWALFAALLALGVMSIAWMVVIAVLITLERLLPWRQTAARGAALALALLALAVAVAPEDVPGLTIPGSSAGMHTMGQRS
jgi:predicted metal-binding membrane protein